MTTQNIYASTVNSFYLAFYGRPADPAGLAFWSSQLLDADGDLATITRAFASSEEALTRFESSTVSERIADIYQQLFNRAPDATGLAYWTSTITSGNATLADVSIAILGGAQGSDKSLSTLRLQAADAFTKAVETNNSGYSGYASIEAARMLVRGVTADSSATDVNTLVNAAVSFADTATKNPVVVEAIATGSSLLGLFDTPRGLSDPVALAQALADTAKAALGDPVTLNQLLRGGGMVQVLKVMPPSATLKDVVKALAEGGLPAAVEVVYPPAPVVTTPTRTIDITFSGVTQGDDDLVNDHVTNRDSADVTFSYTGADLVSGQHFEFSLDGKNWNELKGSAVDTVHNTVTIGDLSLGHQHGIQGFTLPQDVTTSITMRAVQGSRVLDSAQVQIIHDSAAPTAGVSFLRLLDGVDGDARTSETTASALFTIDGPLGDGIIQYRLAGSTTWNILGSDRIDGDGVFAIADIDLATADQTVEVRVIDAAGNVGASIAQLIDGPANSEPLSYGVMPTPYGPIVMGNFVGDMFMTNGSVDTPVVAIGGSGKNTGNDTILGPQSSVVTGTFKLVPTSNETAEAMNPFEFTLGTSKGDTISGNVVWGFEGNDIISRGTNANGLNFGGGDIDDIAAFLLGGAGDDTITGGKGADIIVGGEGADRIDITESVSAADRIVYLDGDTATVTFVDGGSTVGMDVINGFGVEDTIEILDWDNTGATIGSSYLASGSGHDLAIVRGTNVNGAFTAGGSVNDRDYMVQWADGINVNSIIISNFGPLTPIGVIDSNGTNLRFELPEVQESGGASINFGLMIRAEYASITGVANRDGFLLENIASGSGVETNVTLMPVADFVIVDEVNPGIYSMKWETGTFATSGGVMAADAFGFAGGTARSIDHQGFAINAPQNLQTDEQSANSTISNDAYLAGSGFNGRIHTGGGHDAVADAGGTMTLAYSEINAASYDMIFGFDHGNDTILFENQVAQLIDRNGSGQIDWENVHLINADTEAVALQVTDRMTISEGADMWASASAVNAQISGGLGEVETLLILAQSVNHANDGALFFYRNLDDNGQINGNELTVIASFSDGMPMTGDIEVIGSVPP